VLSDKRKIAKTKHRLKKIMARINRLGALSRRLGLSEAEYRSWIMARLSKKILKYLAQIPEEQYPKHTDIRSAAAEELLQRDILGSRYIHEDLKKVKVKRMMTWKT